MERIEDVPVDTMLQVRVESFGYGHGPAPEATVVVDLRHALHDPMADPAMRELTGLYPQVVTRVMATPGAVGIRDALIATTVTLLDAMDPGGWRVDIAIGCGGGRHRSVTMANQLGHALRARGVGVEISHRDILRPVLKKGQR